MTSNSYVDMKEITEQEFRDFVKVNDHVIIGKNKISIGKPKKIKEY
jgi:hypothetical protein